MSSIVESMMSELGGGTLASLGQAVGATPAQTQSMVGAALPALISGLANNAGTPSGAASLATALDRDHQPNLLEQLGAAGGAGGLGALLPAALGMLQGGPSSGLPKALDGGGILGHIFGGQASSVANDAAKASGVDASMMMKLLVMLAPIVMSSLGTLKSRGGLDASALAGLLTSERQKLGAPAGPPGASTAKSAPASNRASAPASTSASPGFGADDLMKVGGALMQSGLLNGLFK